MYSHFLIAHLRKISSDCNLIKKGQSKEAQQEGEGEIGSGAGRDSSS